MDAGIIAVICLVGIPVLLCAWYVSIWITVKLVVKFTVEELHSTQGYELVRDCAKEVKKELNKKETK
jgi:hypothetical protein